MYSASIISHGKIKELPLSFLHVSSGKDFSIVFPPHFKYIVGVEYVTATPVIVYAIIGDQQPMYLDDSERNQLKGIPSPPSLLQKHS